MADERAFASSVSAGASYGQDTCSANGTLSASCSISTGSATASLVNGSFLTSSTQDNSRASIQATLNYEIIGPNAYDVPLLITGTTSVPSSELFGFPGPHSVYEDVGLQVATNTYFNSPTVDDYYTRYVNYDLGECSGCNYQGSFTLHVDDLANVPGTVTIALDAVGLDSSASLKNLSIAIDPSIPNASLYTITTDAPGIVSVPEIDASSGASAIALLAGIILIFRGPRLPDSQGSLRL